MGDPPILRPVILAGRVSYGPSPYGILSLGRYRLQAFSAQVGASRAVSVRIALRASDNVHVTRVWPTYSRTVLEDQPDYHPLAFRKKSLDEDRSAPVIFTVNFFAT